MRNIGWLALLALFGCARSASPDHGSIPEGSGGMAGGPTGGMGGSSPPDAEPTTPFDLDQPGPAPFARLTALEYRSTLRDLLGVTELPADLFRGFDVWQAGFASGVGRGPGDAETILAIAVRAAEEASRSLAPLLPCALPPAAAEEEACVQRFIARFGLRAYRRPLDAAEQAALLQLYRTLRGPESAADFPGAIRLLIEAMLQSPFFVYRWEVTPPLVEDGTLVRFGPYELASRLSYGLLATMPDEQLFAAAAADQLATPEQLERQVRRLLADPKAADMVHDFYTQLVGADPLLDLQKAPGFGFSPELARSMLAETRAFTGQLMVGPGARGTLLDLLGSSASFVDGGLARIYGLPGVPAEAPLGPAQLDPARRAGLLTQTAFLTANSDAEDTGIVQRGQLVFERILCQELPPPDSMEVPAIPDPMPGSTTRERFQRHAMAPCAKCHLEIDPLGFAFGNYDPVGAWRDTEPQSTKPIDASGALNLPSGELRFMNGVDLARKLAQLEEVRACLGKQWFRYLMRRKEGPGDARSLRLGREAFDRSGHALTELVVSLTRTRAFTHRTPARGEVRP